MKDYLENLIPHLDGPIMVLGASGFIGANLMRALIAKRPDVVGTTSLRPAWRLEGVDASHLFSLDALNLDRQLKIVNKVAPKTIFNCLGYGGYSFQGNTQLIYRTNFEHTITLLDAFLKIPRCTYIHSGSSSEYGTNSSAPHESDALRPNSHYAVSKVAAAMSIQHYGEHLGLRCANLRLYSVYGPYEDPLRLMPNLIGQALTGHLPPFVGPEISRDFIYADDACRAFALAALNLRPELYGQSFNVATGVRTTIAELAELARKVFHIDEQPVFGTMPNRRWDLKDWWGNPEKAGEQLGFKAHIGLEEGLRRNADWFETYPLKKLYQTAKQPTERPDNDCLSAIIACYKDGLAIPVMYERLVQIFTKLGVNYQIIFVNDNSPDDTEEKIRALSWQDNKVMGINHSRNFGSQSAFLSGLELATGQACILLDGDLQDPPELIEPFYHKWKEGYEVVYGRRIKRDTSWFLALCYKAFYRIFRSFSYIDIPLDAGDFSLMDRNVVNHLLKFPERDLFLRGLRAFVGFKQTGVDYIRPKRPFGVSTNNIFSNIVWAKKGILSFSFVPINALTNLGVILFGLSLLAGFILALLKLTMNDIAPRGATTTLLTIMFFGSLNLLAVSIVGEYVGKIISETKSRPRFIRRSVIKFGRTLQSPSNLDK